MPGFQYLLLLLAAVSNLGLIVVLTRLRQVMNAYLTAIEQFNPSTFVEAKGQGFLGRAPVVTTFRVLLLMSALISLGGMFIVRDSAKRESGARRVIEVIEVEK
jgi:hypothetical protein